MGRPHPMALRERVVAFVEEGNSHRSAAARFRVSVKFVNDMVILKRETGALVLQLRFMLFPDPMWLCRLAGSGLACLLRTGREP